MPDTAITDAAPKKLAYFGTQISPNQIVSKQGYLVCMNVPICRTGMQSYLGSELEGHPGYDPAWGLLPHERYDVLRPLDEVTSPATVASFEGNTVVDEHPNPVQYPGSLVTCENDQELNRGHGQNVRIGDVLPDSGETPLMADLHVKDIDLIRKVDEQGIRDISCGYTFTLARRADGQLIQTNIRGNHIAVVPTGRAGKEVAIVDAEPTTPQKEKNPVKNLKNWLLGKGIIAAATATDADPEKIAELAKEAAMDEAKEAAEKKAAEKAAADAEVAEAKKKEEEKAAKDAAAEAVKAAKDTEVEDLEEPSDDKAEVITDAEEIEEIEGMGESTLKGKGVMDSARALVQVLRPIVGSGQLPKAAVDAYNAHVKALNAAKGTKGNPYSDFVFISKPEGAATDSAASTQINPGQFFNGRSYAEGKRLYEEALAKQKGAK